MLSSERSFSRILKAVIAAGLVAGALTACHGNLLEVRDPDVVTPDQLTGPNVVPALNAGVISDFREMLDNYVRYSGLLIDEFLLAGTFSSRQVIDARDIEPDNATVTDEVYSPLQVTVVSADRAARQLAAAVGDPDYAQVAEDVANGLARARLFGGYDRIFLAEAFCQSILMNPVAESAPLLPKDRAADALGLLKDAETSANAAGLDDAAAAAVIGQARAMMFLGDYQGAAQAVSSIPTAFAYTVAYSTNTTAEENEVYQLTWGDKQALRWTVGDGTDASRHDERWPFYDEWLAQGLLIPPGQHDREAFGSPNRPVSLQTEYGGVDPGGAAQSRTGAGAAAPIVLASGWEAQMIQAEAELRAGQYGAAQSRINALLSETAQTDNPIRKVNPNVPFGAFAPVALSPDSSLSANLRQIGRARAAGMWLQGQRLGFLRRLALFDDIDFYPTGTAGQDLAYPVVQRELDNNPNIDKACPSGPPWR